MTKGVLASKDPSRDFGGHTIAVGDVDQDGDRDLIVTERAVEMGARGALFAVSSRELRVLYSVECPLKTAFHCCSFGHELCALSDLDGDGVADFAISDPSGHPLDCNSKPYGVWFVSSARGELLRSFVERDIPNYGESLLSPGDIDGDGVSDLLIRSGWMLPENIVDAISGRTGERIYRVDVGADDWGSSGGRLIRCEDLDGDGLRDFASVASSHYPAIARREFHSSATGALIEGDSSLGTSVRSCGVDLDGDQRAEWLHRRSASNDRLRTFEVVSTLDSGTLASIEAYFGVLDPLGDLDGDGSPEFALTEPETRETSDRVTLFSLRIVEGGRDESR